MSTNKTANYNLNQWVKSDQVRMEDFNADNAKIDAALAGLSSGKADKSAVSSMQSTLSSQITALQNTASGQGTALDLRNCRFVTGTYTGNGGCGAKSVNTLSFPQKPVFLFVASVDYVGSFCAVRGQETIFHTVLTEQVKQIAAWGNTTVTWYNVANLSTSSAERQLNSNGKIYYYFAILEL